MQDQARMEKPAMTASTVPQYLVFSGLTGRKSGWYTVLHVHVGTHSVGTPTVQYDARRHTNESSQERLARAHEHGEGGNAKPRALARACAGADAAKIVAPLASSSRSRTVAAC